MLGEGVVESMCVFFLVVIVDGDIDSFVVHDGEPL